MSSLVSIFIPGEEVTHSQNDIDGLFIITDCRIMAITKNTKIILFKSIIDRVSLIDAFTFHILRRDGGIHRLTFSRYSNCKKLYDLISPSTEIWAKTAISFFQAQKNTENKTFKTRQQWRQSVLPTDNLIIHAEYNRLEFDHKWRISTFNSNYRLCPTYPSLLVVPREISDSMLILSAQFRSHGRIPTVVWRCRENGAVLARSAQPNVSVMGYRCDADECYINAIRYAASGRDFAVVDCRSYLAAMANRLKGGGVESEDNYRGVRVQFLSLPNIHYVRQYFAQMTKAIHYDSLDLTDIVFSTSTNWACSVNSLLGHSVKLSKSMLEQGTSLLVHCSDGWDRTPQITSLVQIMLEPYYRTTLGFQVLIEKEWVLYGHQFSLRTSRTAQTEDSPIFLQFLDCVYQLLQQFPDEFQFNKQFLKKLCEHVYSGLFADFLCNTQRELDSIDDSAFCLWSYLTQSDLAFRNLMFCPVNSTIFPLVHQNAYQCWRELFFEDTTGFYSLDISLRFLEADCLLPRFDYIFEDPLIPSEKIILEISSERFGLSGFVFMDSDGLLCFSNPSVKQRWVTSIRALYSSGSLDKEEAISQHKKDILSPSPQKGGLCIICNYKFGKNVRRFQCRVCCCSVCEKCVKEGHDVCPPCKLLL